jgi:hypothetical protein
VPTVADPPLTNSTADRQKDVLGDTKMKKIGKPGGLIVFKQKTNALCQQRGKKQVYWSKKFGLVTLTHQNQMRGVRAAWAFIPPQKRGHKNNYTYANIKETIA